MRAAGGDLVGPGAAGREPPRALGQHDAQPGVPGDVLHTPDDLHRPGALQLVEDQVERAASGSPRRDGADLLVRAQQLLDAGPGAGGDVGTAMSTFETVGDTRLAGDLGERRGLRAAPVGPGSPRVRGEVMAAIVSPRARAGEDLRRSGTFETYDETLADSAVAPRPYLTRAGTPTVPGVPAPRRTDTQTLPSDSNRHRCTARVTSVLFQLGARAGRRRGGRSARVVGPDPVLRARGKVLRRTGPRRLRDSSWARQQVPAARDRAGLPHGPRRGRGRLPGGLVDMVVGVGGARHVRVGHREGGVRGEVQSEAARLRRRSCAEGGHDRAVVRAEFGARHRAAGCRRPCSAPRRGRAAAELAATPPPIIRWSTPSSLQARTALRVSTSTTASWKDAATSRTGTSFARRPLRLDPARHGRLQPEKAEVSYAVWRWSGRAGRRSRSGRPPWRAGSSAALTAAAEVEPRRLLRRSGLAGRVRRIVAPVGSRRRARPCRRPRRSSDQRQVEDPLAVPAQWRARRARRARVRRSRRATHV
ncbi:hypothetical protein SALBM217S_04878 [Streptomyces griseoloalbus]